MTFLSTAGPEPFRHLWSFPTKCQHLSSQLLLFLASVRRSAETSKLPNIKICGLFASFRAVTSLPECAFEGGTSGHKMGLDVNSCCRLCLASASSPNATHVDLAQQQEVAEMVQELFGLKVRLWESLGLRGANAGMWFLADQQFRSGKQTSLPSLLQEDY